MEEAVVKGFRCNWHCNFWKNPHLLGNYNRESKESHSISLKWYFNRNSGWYLISSCKFVPMSLNFFESLTNQCDIIKYSSIYRQMWDFIHLRIFVPLVYIWKLFLMNFLFHGYITSLRCDCRQSQMLYRKAIN